MKKLSNAFNKSIRSCMVILLTFFLSNYASNRKMMARNIEKKEKIINTKGKQTMVTIFQRWQNSIGGQTEVITLTKDKFSSTISGMGMPPQGVKSEKKIAKIVPQGESENGMLILGPQENLMKPYETLHWYKLTDKSVNFYIGSAQFDSVKEAEESSKAEQKYARTFVKTE